MKRKIAAAVFVVLLVLGGLAGVKTLHFQKLMAAGKACAPSSESFSSAVVREEKWQGTIEAIGSVTAVQGVKVNPDIPGTVREIAFEPGVLGAKEGPRAAWPCQSWSLKPEAMAKFRNDRNESVSLIAVS
jgi:hypothetical protein